MRPRSLAAVSAVVLALAGAGTAAAGPDQRTQPDDVRAATASPGAGTDPFGGVELAYLRLDKKTLLAKLQQGQTLAEIATAQGKSARGLIDAIVAAAKAKLDPKVRAGSLSASKEAAALARLRIQLGTIVTRSYGAGTKVPATYMKPLLAYLQIDNQTLEQELKNGKTLAQVAVAHGKTVDGVTAAILGPVQAQLDAQVTAGKLTAADHDALLAQAQASVAKLVAGNA
jgi:hypothetical protein